MAGAAVAACPLGGVHRVAAALGETAYCGVRATAARFHTVLRGVACFPDRPLLGSLLGSFLCMTPAWVFRGAPWGLLGGVEHFLYFSSHERCGISGAPGARQNGLGHGRFPYVECWRNSRICLSLCKLVLLCAYGGDDHRVGTNRPGTYKSTVRPSTAIS